MFTIGEELEKVRQRREWIEDLLNMLVERKSKKEYVEEYSFTPEISETSRRIASRLLPREHSKRSAATVIEESKAQAELLRPSVASEAIVAQICDKYGSVASYHAAREASKASWEALTRAEAEEAELKECTFKPAAVTSTKRRSNSKVKISGLEKFVNRQAKAREKEEDTRPGSGKVYTGNPTNPVPFSFKNVN